MFHCLCKNSRPSAPLLPTMGFVLISGARGVWDC
uniref:Uncharacterized protein n=1 Tax=Anguilla anguilla TaxID=7936 RepID=A0A0E9PA28_ANGAN